MQVAHHHPLSWPGWRAGLLCVGQDLSLQHSHLQSGRHSNFHFLCSAGRYTPLLGKCPLDYSPLQNLAEEFRLLSDSAKEEIDLENRTSGINLMTGLQTSSSHYSYGAGRPSQSHESLNMFPPRQMSYFPPFLSSFPIHNHTDPSRSYITTFIQLHISVLSTWCFVPKSLSHFRT